METRCCHLCSPNQLKSAEVLCMERGVLLTEAVLPGASPGTVPAQFLHQKPVTKCPLLQPFYPVLAATSGQGRAAWGLRTRTGKN